MVKLYRNELLGQLDSELSYHHHYFLHIYSINEDTQNILICLIVFLTKMNIRITQGNTQRFPRAEIN